MTAGGKLTAVQKTLLHPPSGREADRRAYIRAYLVELGVPERAIRAEYQTQNNGAVDLYLTNRRIILEIKKAGRLKNGPRSRDAGAKPGESAFEQIDRYVRDERSREQLHLDQDADGDLPWIGIVTDGQSWWAWEWEPRQEDVVDVPKENVRWQGQRLTAGNLDRLGELLGRSKTAGKEWATADMASEFGDVRHDLKKMYERRRAMRSTKTQKGLWLEQLRSSGNAPAKGDTDDMFVTHTMLILISRMISYSGDRYDEDKITEGFVKWVDMREMDRLQAIMDRYNWRQHTGDVLRSLYQDFIPEQHRKIYGEYYTPDWLAELLCGKVIDDGFVAEQLERYNAGRDVLHVLDPSCGSGTFLYHGAKHILESDPVKNSGMEKHDAAKFVCGMIRGIDIHPVAVEMSRANLKRLFPQVADSDIVVYQGDSLLVQRPEARLLGAGGLSLPLMSPGSRHLVLPAWFVKSARDVSMFVESAKNDKDMAPGLGASLDGYDRDRLLEAYGQMREIIRHESNGVWKWYILNQAGPLNLRGRCGRIVSNPPWVRYNKIGVKSRQDEMRGMAEDLELWVGGDASTSFDVAALFVDRCAALYMEPSHKKSGWVVPQGSMKAKGWDGFRAKLGGGISCVWNMYRLPFPNTPTCATFFGIDLERRDLRKKPGERLNHYDSWDAASEKTYWAEPPPEFPAEASRWVDEKGKPLARNGAAIFPYCLTHVAELQDTGRGVWITTRRSGKAPWRKLGPLRGTVPERWVRDCVSTENLLSYALPTTIKCILPLGPRGWDPDRRKNDLWQNASDLYEENCGGSKSTPKRLESQLDFNGKLSSQFGRTGDSVVYNTAGDNLYAARLRDNQHVVLTQLFVVPCRSRDEALFLESVLNAEILLPAFKGARQSDRHFVGHIWTKVPIPRFDPANPLHRRLASLGGRAEHVAMRAYDPDSTLARNRVAVKKAVADDGTSGRIDGICAKLMPRHVP